MFISCHLTCIAPKGLVLYSSKVLLIVRIVDFSSIQDNPVSVLVKKDKIIPQRRPCIGNELE